MSTPADAVPDSLVLAAIERAARHRAPSIPTVPVPVWAITDHLAITRRSRRVRSQLNALEASGAIKRSSRHGFTVWGLTSTGRARLKRARRAGSVELPESPQHREWRNARTLAEQEIARFRLELRGRLTDARRLLDAKPPAGSDAFFEMATSLRLECWRLGSAIYCLREWPEPDDATPDIDERLTPAEKKLDPAEQANRRALRTGRRNTRLWNTPDRAASSTD
jgi:hypothetical protein